MRNKTEFRNIDRKTGKVTRITGENGMFFIGDSNVRAEGKMVHYKGINSVRNSNYKKELILGDEFSDYCYTSEDL